jgi:hypothetical protein
MPQNTQRTRTIVAAVVLYIPPAIRTLARQLSGVPAEPFEHGYLSQWIFWAIFVFAIAISFFWPLANLPRFGKISPAIVAESDSHCRKSVTKDTEK